MQFHKDKEKILIIDFGSQVTKLIARRVRELGVYSEIITPKDLKKLKEYKNIKGLIFSGGPEVKVTPTISNPSFLCFFIKFIKSGISFLQGPHHVPQKLRRTTFPLI